jgi:hypothetical protein
MAKERREERKTSNVEKGKCVDGKSIEASDGSITVLVELTANCVIPTFLYRERKLGCGTCLVPYK